MYSAREQKTSRRSPLASVRKESVPTRREVGIVSGRRCTLFWGRNQEPRRRLPSPDSRASRPRKRGPRENRVLFRVIPVPHCFYNFSAVERGVSSRTRDGREGDSGRLWLAAADRVARPSGTIHTDRPRESVYTHRKVNKVLTHRRSELQMGIIWAVDEVREVDDVAALSLWTLVRERRCLRLRREEWTPKARSQKKQ